MGHYFLYAAIGHLGAAIATGGQSATPFVTVALAAVFLGESLSPGQWIAGVTIVFGATLLVSNQYVIQADETPGL